MSGYNKDSTSLAALNMQINMRHRFLQFNYVNQLNQLMELCAKKTEEHTCDSGGGDRLGCIQSLTHLADQWVSALATSAVVKVIEVQCPKHSSSETIMSDEISLPRE